MSGAGENASRKRGEALITGSTRRSSPICRRRRSLNSNVMLPPDRVNSVAPSWREFKTSDSAVSRFGHEISSLRISTLAHGQARSKAHLASRGKCKLAAKRAATSARPKAATPTSNRRSHLCKRLGERLGLEESIGKDAQNEDGTNRRIDLEKGAIYCGERPFRS